MGIIPPNIVDEIMQTSIIEEVIGEFVQLKKAGANLKGLSPFTDEKTPSFVVSPAKQIFKCFSSGKGGTVVTFLMEKEHFSYPEALRWLADKYGIEIPESRPATAEELAEKSERESLYLINEFAKDFFQNNLLEEQEGKTIGLSYFEERGFHKDIIEKFQLGYCPTSGDAFTKSALEKGYKLEYLEKVGLVKTKNDRSFDFFSSRVLFPIHSVTGRVLGFGGRTLRNDKKIAKYFNSPESPIYNKSEILYGLHFAKGDMVKYDNCFLCEGYTDVISMYQAGVQNVVSSSGTSLTKGQIKLISRYTKNITILYDGDAAGIKASFRGIDLILEEGLNVKVVLFPEGEDPDSFAKSVSKAELEDYIEDKQQDFISFKANILLDEESKDPLKRAELIREIVQSVALIPDQITRTVFVQNLAEQFDVEESILSNELFKIRRGKSSTSMFRSASKQQPNVAEARDNDTEIDATQALKSSEPNIAELDLIRFLVLYGANAVNTEQLNDKGELDKVETSVIELICHELNEDEMTFEDPIFAKIHSIYTAGLSENILYQSSYLKRLEDQAVVRVVSNIESNERELSINWEAKYNIFTSRDEDKLDQAVPSAIYAFKLHKIEEQIKIIRGKLEDKNLSDEQINDLLSEQIILEKIKGEFSHKLGRTILH